MPRKALLLALVAALAVSAAGAEAKTICVNSASGCDDTAATLQLARDKAVNNPGKDRIQIGAGTYPSTSLGFPADSPIEIVGAGRDATIVEGRSDANSVMSFFTEDAAVESLTVRLVGGGNQLGIDFQGTGAARHVTVDSTASQGGSALILRHGGAVEDAVVRMDPAPVPVNYGIKLISDGATVNTPVAATVSDVDVTGGYALSLQSRNGPNGPVKPYGPVTLRRVKATGGTYGIYVFGPISVTGDQVVARALQGQGAGMHVESGLGAGAPTSVELRHATLADTAPLGNALEATVFGADALGVTFHDSLLVGGNGDIAFGSQSGPSTVTLDHSAYRKFGVRQNGSSGKVVSGAGNLDMDRSPKAVVDAAGGDFRPAPGASIIDNGTPGGLGPAESTTDVLGAPRLTDGDGDGVVTRDMGAVEAAAKTNPAHVTPIFQETPTQGPGGGTDKLPTSSIKVLPKFGKRVISGIASDDKGVKLVNVSITRIAKVKKKPACQALNAKGKWVAAGKPAKGKCAPQFLLLAKGTTKWSLTLKKALPAGTYAVSSRATDTARQLGKATSAKSLKLKAPKKKKK
jgi:hypothetical protein